MKIKSNYKPYKSYAIEFNFYGKNEYVVHFCGDDIWFFTEEEAKKFIDKMMEEKK